MMHDIIMTQMSMSQLCDVCLYCLLNSLSHMLVSHAGRRRLRSADIDTDQHTVRRPELCSRWTAALEQSAGQDLPARQWHWRISLAAKVVFVQVTPQRIVTFWVYAPLNTLTHSLTHKLAKKRDLYRNCSCEWNSPLTTLVQDSC